MMATQHGQQGSSHRHTRHNLINAGRNDRKITGADLGAQRDLIGAPERMSIEAVLAARTADIAHPPVG
jgi:hypothetical protein